jgi:hypothetical protein
MKKTKRQIKESIAASATSPLSYIVFIDSMNCIDKVRGYIKMIFPQSDSEIVKSWFKKVLSSDTYKANEENLRAITSRFSGNPQLKGLFLTLEKIKSMPYTESEKESHEKDIQKLIEKIGAYIKRRLTNEDFDVLDQLTSEINHVSEKIGNMIDDDALKLMSVEEPEPEPEPDNKDKKSEKNESKISERLRNKFRKKIKEIVRTHLMIRK